MAKTISQDYFRSIIFGVEDALVSTTGLMVGINAGSHDRAFVILSGFVVVWVQALSMGAGQYLSEKAVHEMTNSEHHADSPFISGAVMFVAFVIAGIFPIMPFTLLPLDLAVKVGILLAFIGLFILGFLKGKYLHIPPLKSALEMLAIGGGAALVGMVIGNWFKV